MTLVLDVALRSSVPIAAALLACVLLRRRSAALRHSVLTAALAAAIAAVPLAVLLPSWSVAIRTAASPADSSRPSTPGPAPSPAAELAAASAAGPSVEAPSPAPAAGQPTDARAVLRIALVLWLAGAVAGAAVLLVGIVRLVRLTGRSVPVTDGPWNRYAADVAARYRIRRPVAVLVTSASHVLATWGVLRPRVLLPAQALAWDGDRARVSLCHELAHVRRYDWPIQVTADVLRTVFWFNPLLWILCASLRRESEQACDDAVLDWGVPGPDYASHLVEIARACRRPGSSWVPVMSIARPSSLEGRVRAMLDTGLNRQAPTWRAWALVLVSLAGIVLPAATLRIAAQGVAPGALTGYVYDSSGGVLPGVEVTLIDERKEQRSAVSDGTGQFRFQNVSAGEYVLDATLPGFRTLRNELVLEAPRDWTRNITMQVGELQETISVVGKRPAKAAALPREASRSNPVRVGGNIKQPLKVKSVNPIYPAAMQAAGLEGLVEMDAIIGADGRVVSARVVSADVHPEFARAAEEAVRQWEFTPTLLNNRAVEVEMTVSVEFSLQD